MKNIIKLTVAALIVTAGGQLHAQNTQLASARVGATLDQTLLWLNTYANYSEHETDTALTTRSVVFEVNERNQLSISVEMLYARTRGAYSNTTKRTVVPNEIVEISISPREWYGREVGTIDFGLVDEDRNFWLFYDADLARRAFNAIRHLMSFFPNNIEFQDHFELESLF